MACQVVWTKIVLEEFIKIGGLTADEEHIMRTRCKGWTRTRQALELGMSISTVDRLIRSCKRKYDAVQPFSCILPPRKKSAKELYLDEN